MEDIGYIGYRDAKVGTTFVPIYTGEPISSVVATILATTAASWSQWFSHPAQDALNVISQMKPHLSGADPRTRLGLVLAASKSISTDAKDVDAEKNLLWYRQAYANDFTALTPDDMNYWNTYLNSIRSSHRDGNNMYFNLQSAMFTPDQVNYNATPTTAVSSLLSSTGLNTNTLIYIAIGVGLYLLIKK